MLEKQKEMVVQFSKKMLSRGLTRGTGGNISVCDRDSGLAAISGSGIDYDHMTTEDIVIVDLAGNIVEGSVKPSIELAMHLACYKKRDDITAVVHTHSLYATTIACMLQGIDSIHYLLGFAGGPVDCIPFYPIGTEELASHVADALVEKNAVLLGNHGLVAVGHTLDFAFAAAEETEFVAEVYYRTRMLGGGHLLTPEEMAPMIQAAKGYVH